MTYNVFGGTSSIQSIGCDAQLGGNVPVGEEKEMSGAEFSRAICLGRMAAEKLSSRDSLSGSPCRSMLQ